MGERANAVYSLGQILLGTVLGGPVAGSFFAAENFRRLGNPERATRTFAWGFLALMALLVIGQLLPAHASGTVLAAVYAGSYREYVKHIQGSKLNEALAAGAPKQSWWFVSAVSLLILIIMLLAIGVALVVARRVGQ